MTDRAGLPLAVLVSAGHEHESRYFEPVMDAVRIGRRRRPDAVAADKGYSYVRVRQWCRARGIKVVIPTRKDQRRRPGFDKALYRERNVVERCIGWLKECRRVATRYEKLAVHYAGFVQLAMIQRLLQAF